VADLALPLATCNYRAGIGDTGAPRGAHMAASASAGPAKAPLLGVSADPRRHAAGQPAGFLKQRLKGEPGRLKKGNQGEVLPHKTSWRTHNNDVAGAKQKRSLGPPPRVPPPQKRRVRKLAIYLKPN
jgi:hypothetical protein